MRIAVIALLISMISIPDGSAQNTLFKKYDENPIIKIGSSEPDWRAIHVANAAILTPDETPDGTWRIYIRGSGRTPAYHDQIGILYQETANFNPYGPWLEYENNPVLQYGAPGSYDDWHLLDCSPVIGENGDVYFYYKAVNFGNASSLAGASSSDGGFTFTKFDTNPLKLDVGANDAIYHDGLYYVYYGDGLYNRHTNSFDSKLSVYLKISQEPDMLADKDSILVLAPGGGPDEFDRESVNGARIFRLDNKWFMIYQGSDRHFDFPHRFHAAWSEDLVNWIKIDNDFPLMTRGDWGDWDQGGIWYGEVFEHQDTLYMLYEGWGCYCIPDNRDVPYFPGNSRTGIARVSVADFLLWADGGYDSTWVVQELGPDGTVVDFETYSPEFNTTHDMYFDVIENPFPDDVNSSTHVGMIETTADRWEAVESEPFVNRFDFTQATTFTMKVYSETEGNVYFRVEHPDRTDFGEIQIRRALNVTNQWVEMTFDFSGYDPEPDLYGRIVLYFDGGETNSGNNWYFDDITFIPSTTNDVTEHIADADTDQGIKIIDDRPNQQIILPGAKMPVDYSIYTITGIRVKEGSEQVISIRNLEKGVYVLKAGNEAAVFIK